MATGELALARLCDPAAEVSCHYLVWEDGRIDQLVADGARAWHAGQSFWAGERDMNGVSVGIEIVNAGHDGGRPPYPAAQIDAVIALCRDICARHAIPPARVLAHSDIAPDRKIDPGEWFPWGVLAAAGVGLWVEPVPASPGTSVKLGDEGDGVAALQALLAAFGFRCPASATFDGATRDAVAAFQRHWRPRTVDGIGDISTIGTLTALAAMRQL